MKINSTKVIVSGSLAAVLVLALLLLPRRPAGVPRQTLLVYCAAGKESRYPQLMTRLLETIVSTQSRQRFEGAGFGWRATPP